MDMSEPYVQSTRAHLPGSDGKIVFDKFHVVKDLHDIFREIRTRKRPSPNTACTITPTRTKGAG
jgi:transposase